MINSSLAHAPCGVVYEAGIAQFRYIKIQPKTIDLGTRLRGLNYRVCGVYSPEPRSDVYCFRPNFKISKLGYCVRIWLSDALIANSSADCVVSFFIEKNYSVKINY